MKLAISPADYSRHLRTIGQDLENLRLYAFNLECAGDFYLVWARARDVEIDQVARAFPKRSLWRKLWREGAEQRTRSGEDPGPVRPNRNATKCYRYSLDDIARMEKIARERRRTGSRSTDGNTLSQLLRTVGALVGRNGERLLGIAWQSHSVNVVVETVAGRREVDVFRPDNLYDYWVRMYLRRADRTRSELPR